MNSMLAYCTPYFLSAVLMSVIALFTYRRRSVRGAWYLILVCLAAAVWSTTEGLLYLGMDLQGNMRITQFQYLGIALLPPSSLLFVISVFGDASWITRKRIAVLFIIAACIIVLVWTNPLHRLIYPKAFLIDSGPFPMLRVIHGPLWWIILGYHYFLLAVMSIILIHHVLTFRGLRRSQARILLASVATVWAVNGIYVTGNSPLPNMDLGPLTFILVAAAMAWGFFQYSLLDIIPVARAEVFRKLDDAILVLDGKNRIIDMNPSAESIFNLAAADIVGEDVREVFGDDAARLSDPAWENASVETPMFISGRRRIYDTRISAIKGERGEMLGRVVTLRDITERKNAEARLRESEDKLARSRKMESLGLLAGGVAHDLNNVLSGVVGYPELILMKLPEDSEIRKPVETMQKSGERAVAIVQDLLTVARGVAMPTEPVNLNALVEDYLNSPEFKRLEHYHPAVTVETELGKDLDNINGSPVHVRKVVMNLVSNASEAIKKGGNIRISTSNRHIDTPLKGYLDVPAGDYVVLTVSDDGSGISPEDLERVFEPFYTKKVMGRSGTGLGLAVVWNILQDHKGGIDVTTGDDGTTFALYFPATADAPPDAQASHPANDVRGNRETILIVDDVEGQRQITSDMLDALNYSVETVSSGEAAVDYLKHTAVDLLVLDMIMDPGINGREAYERILKMHPGQKAVIVSGYAETREVKRAQQLGAGPFVKKPFTLETIGQAIKKALGDR